MGSSESLPQAQCPVDSVQQAQCQVQQLQAAQIPIGCKICGNSKVKWKCEECVLLMCDMCSKKEHSKKGHHIIDITTLQVKIADVKEYKTKMHNIEFLAEAHDNSLWMGVELKEDHFRLDKYKYNSALQNVKLVEDKVKVKSSFKIKVFSIAVTPTNDILLATEEPKLKQIKHGSNKVTDSVYCEDTNSPGRVHVTKDHRVIVCSGNKVVTIMDTDGKHLTRYEEDENNRPIFSYITSITSTMNGNIFVADGNYRKVVVVRNTNIINIYKGQSTVNSEDKRFYPSSVVTTPMDNVIVAGRNTNTLHILNNTGNLLTIYNTADIGLSFPEHLAIITEGSFTVLYLTRRNFNSLYKMVITGC